MSQEKLEIFYEQDMIARGSPETMLGRAARPSLGLSLSLTMCWTHFCHRPESPLPVASDTLGFSWLLFKSLGIWK